jgi:branched-chain amino acid transport system substrate-binding protein
MKYTQTILVLVALIALVGCTGNVVKEQETFKIGWTGPLTGPNSAVGTANLKGIQLAVEDLNAKGGIEGQEVELVFLDEASDDKQAITNFQRFVDFDKIDVMMFASYGGHFGASGMADEKQIVTINTIDTSEELATLGEYNFAIGIYDESIGRSMAEFIPKDAKVGLMYANDDAFISFAKDTFVEEFEGDLIAKEGYDMLETDFRTSLLKMRDAEYIALISFDEGGLVLKQAKELGMETEFVGIDTVEALRFMENSKGAADGMYFTFWESSETEKVDEFVQKYESKFDTEPEVLLFSVTGYDATMVVAEAMKSEKSLKDAMYEVEDYKGLAGSITIDSDGITRSIQETMYVRTKDGYQTI